MNDDFLDLLSALLDAEARFDILTEVSGVRFTEAWANQVTAGVGRNLQCPFIGIADLIRNKRAAARDQDLVDVAILERIASRSKRP